MARPERADIHQPGVSTHRITHIFCPPARRAAGLARWRKPREMKGFQFLRSPVGRQEFLGEHNPPAFAALFAREIWRCRRRPAAPGGAMGTREFLHFPGLTPPG